MSFLDLLATRKSDRTSGNGVRPPGAAVASTDPTFPTKALRKFLSCLTRREPPVLLDLGPVVGSNVTFLGDRLGCKIFVEDVFADLDRHVRLGNINGFSSFLETRFARLP